MIVLPLRTLTEDYHLNRQHRWWWQERYFLDFPFYRTYRDLGWSLWASLMANRLYASIHRAMLWFSEAMKREHKEEKISLPAPPMSGYEVQRAYRTTEVELNILQSIFRATKGVFRPGVEDPKTW
jgi:hypothetical protein